MYKLNLKGNKSQMFLNNYEIYSDERGNVLYMTIIFIGKTQCKDGE